MCAMPGILPQKSPSIPAYPAPNPHQATNKHRGLGSSDSGNCRRF